ncbi:MAG TPA: hypothetical protein VKA00_01700 [Trueperaceae bacterium]|nr:hypothetical protein [Trueperaceae bacterium]
MGPHHLGIYDTLVRERLDDLDAIRRRHATQRTALAAAAAGERSPRPPTARLKCRLARALVELAARLDPDLASLRPRRSPFRA